MIHVKQGVPHDAGPRPIDEIQPREIMALIEGIEDRGAGEIATRVLQRVRAAPIASSHPFTASLPLTGGAM